LVSLLATFIQKMQIAKRIFDVVFVVSLLPFLLLPLIIIALSVKVSSPGPVLHWSQRVGRAGRVFKMPKFRTMYVSTPTLATGLLRNPEKWITSTGWFLRRSSLDELPQLWSVLKGDMSLVGPRPVLSSETKLIQNRLKFGIYRLAPGLTGWAQVNGRDNLTDEEKVELDIVYLDRQSILFDLEIILRTVLKVIRGDGVAH